MSSTHMPEDNPRQAKPTINQFEDLRKIQVQVALLHGQDDLEGTMERLMSPTITSEEVLSRLVEYEEAFGAEKGSFKKFYHQNPIRYNLDAFFAVTRDPINALTKLSGVRGMALAPGKTFGFQYMHTGAIMIKDIRIEGPVKRSPVVCIDLDGVHRGMDDELFNNTVGDFASIFSLANHDPLHSVQGFPKEFSKFDKDFRFGGIEFASIVAHADMVERRIEANPDKGREYEKLIESYTENVAKSPTLEIKMYWTSIALRHLLLVFPLDHGLITNFLERSQKDVFKGEELSVQGAKWGSFLERDFYETETDLKHERDFLAVNRRTEYNHGKDSVMRSWLTDYFKMHFGNNFDDKTLPYATYVLLDVLKRGSGVFSIATVVHGEQEYIRDCIQPFFKGYGKD